MESTTWILGRLGPGESGPGQLGPGQLGPGQLGPGPNCPGPSCPFFRSGQLGPGQLGPGQLGPGQLSVFGGGQLGPGESGPIHCVKIHKWQFLENKNSPIIACNFGQQVAPIILLTNLFTGWHQLHATISNYSRGEYFKLSGYRYIRIFFLSCRNQGVSCRNIGQWQPPGYLFKHCQRHNGPRVLSP